MLDAGPAVRALRLTAALLALVVLALPGSAEAARSKPARLVVKSLSNPPGAVAAGDVFTVTGAVQNKGGKSSPALLSFELRNDDVAYALGGGGLANVSPGQTKNFKVDVGIPSPVLTQRMPDGYALVACVRRSRDDDDRCKKAKQRTDVESSFPVQPTPTPTATATETATATPTPEADTQAPTTTDDVPSYYKLSPVVVTLTAADAGNSGLKTTYYTKGANPADPTAFSSQYDPDNRPTLLNGEQIKYFSVDNAGNAEAVKTSQPAKVDAGGPATSDNVPNTYQPGPVTVTLNGTAASGVAATYYTKGANPAEPTTSSSVYNPANKPTLANGEKIKYFSVSNAGVSEPTKTSATAKVDQAPPSTTDDVPATYRNAPVPVTLTAIDPGGSGLAAIRYTLAAAPTASSAVYDPANKPVLANGLKIRYAGVDAVGNVEADKTSPAALVDTAAPSTTDTVTAARNSAPVTVTLTSVDTGGSGVAAIYYTIGTTPATPTTSSPVYDPANKPTLNNGEKISYFAVDNVGNAEAVRTSVAAFVDTTAYTSGARTLNDTLFPTIGNGGYDAQNYAIDLDYTISTKFLEGTSTATLLATQNLSDFSMDFVKWMDVDAVTVNGEPAQFQQLSTDKLIITPATPVKTGQTFTVVVAYGGVETAYIDPDGSQEGFIPSTTRGAIVVCEPVGSMGWFPNNNVPFDKATYTIEMSVPTVASGVPWSVVGPGIMTSDTTADGKRTMVWREDSKTASYDIGLGIGKFDIDQTMSTPTAANPTSVPVTIAVDNAFTTNKATIKTNQARTPSIFDYYATFYGVTYPFSSMGGIVPLINAGYSLETQSKPIYATTTTVTSTGPGIGTIAHENAHGYFGNFLTLTQWKDIWINEGMTEFTSWLWQERVGTPPTTLASRYLTNYTNQNSAAAWAIAPANPPTAADIFNTAAMYTRGALTTYQVMQVMGETDFRDMMNAYLTAPGHPYGNSTTEQFIAMVKAKDLEDQIRDAGPDRTARWTEFFRQWLYVAGTKPTMNKDNFDTFVF